MIDKVLKFLTKRKVNRECGFCKKNFKSEECRNYLSGFGFIKVVTLYCSDDCDKSMDIAINKCFNNKKLSNREKEATKNLRYVDF